MGNSQNNWTFEHLKTQSIEHVEKSETCKLDGASRVKIFSNSRLLVDHLFFSTC